MSEIRFNGLYFHDGGKLWFRFYPENGVSARYVDGKVTPRTAASMISPGQAGFGIGTYKLDGESVDLQLQFPDGPRRFGGTLVGETLNLQYIAEGKQNPTRPYVFQPLDPPDLAIPPVALAHELRARLSNGMVERTALEAAAAVGDPISALALRSVFDVEEVSSRFASLGAPACLRVLLALSWTEDGVWYTPKQGVTKGGTRKEDEGKLLRTLAKWCLNPDDKLLAKAKTEFGEVVRVGPAYQFLDATMKMVLAESESARANAMREALTLYLARDPFAASELVRAKVVPWLHGQGDPLAEMIKNIK